MASATTKNGSSKPFVPSTGTIQVLTANAALADNATFVKATSASGAKTLTLPAAARFPGREFTVYKTDGTGTIVIDGNASEQIDGATTLTLAAAKDVVTLISIGTAWVVKSKVIA